MTWLFSPERYEEIRTIVVDLIEDWGISEYPFSVWSLLVKMGISTIPFSSLPEGARQELLDYQLDAITLYSQDFNPRRTTIFYNDIGCSRERIRFTVAHELGHLVLMHPDTGDEIYEQEANFFANYLLVPAPLISETSVNDAESVSVDFEVSLSCAVSACDRAANRRFYGPSELFEYEQRIVDLCTLEKGGGQLARL